MSDNNNVIEHPAQHANRWMERVAEDLDAMFQLGPEKARRLAKAAAFINDPKMLVIIGRVCGLKAPQTKEFVAYWLYADDDGSE